MTAVDSVAKVQNLWTKESQSVENASESKVAKPRYSVSSSKTFRESLLSSGDSQPLPLGKEDKMKTLEVSHEKGLNKVLHLAYGTVRHQLKGCNFFLSKYISYIYIQIFWVADLSTSQTCSHE